MGKHDYFNIHARVMQRGTFPLPLHNCTGLLRRANPEEREGNYASSYNQDEVDALVQSLYAIEQAKKQL